MIDVRFQSSATSKLDEGAIDVAFGLEVCPPAYRLISVREWKVENCGDAMGGDLHV